MGQIQSSCMKEHHANDGVFLPHSSKFTQHNHNQNRPAHYNTNRTSPAISGENRDDSCVNRVTCTNPSKKVSTKIFLTAGSSTPSQSSIVSGVNTGINSDTNTVFTTDNSANFKVKSTGGGGSTESPSTSNSMMKCNHSAIQKLSISGTLGNEWILHISHGSYAPPPPVSLPQQQTIANGKNENNNINAVSSNFDCSTAPSGMISSSAGSKLLQILGVSSTSSPQATTSDNSNSNNGILNCSIARGKQSHVYALPVQKPEKCKADAYQNSLNEFLGDLSMPWECEDVVNSADVVQRMNMPTLDPYKQGNKCSRNNPRQLRRFGKNQKKQGAINDKRFDHQQGQGKVGEDVALGSSHKEPEHENDGDKSFSSDKFVTRMHNNIDDADTSPDHKLPSATTVVDNERMRQRRKHPSTKSRGLNGPQQSSPMPCPTPLPSRHQSSTKTGIVQAEPSTSGMGQSRTKQQSPADRTTSHQFAATALTKDGRDEDEHDMIVRKINNIDDNCDRIMMKKPVIPSDTTTDPANDDGKMNSSLRIQPQPQAQQQRKIKSCTQVSSLPSQTKTRKSSSLTSGSDGTIQQQRLSSQGPLQDGHDLAMRAPIKQKNKYSNNYVSLNATGTDSTPIVRKKSRRFFQFTKSSKRNNDISASTPFGDNIDNLLVRPHPGINYIHPSGSPRYSPSSMNNINPKSKGVGMKVFTREYIAKSMHQSDELVCLDPKLQIYLLDTKLTQSQCQNIISTTETCAAYSGAYSAYTYAKQTLGCREHDALAAVAMQPAHIAVNTIQRYLSGGCLCCSSARFDRVRKDHDVSLNKGVSTSPPTDSSTVSFQHNFNRQLPLSCTCHNRSITNGPPRPQEQLVLDEREPHVVKYDIVDRHRQKLDMHTDKSEWTFLIALSDYGKDYEGGGTYFEGSDTTYHLMQGQCLIFQGKLRHCGKKINAGKRFLLVGFLVWTKEEEETEEEEEEGNVDASDDCIRDDSDVDVSSFSLINENVSAWDN